MTTVPDATVLCKALEEGLTHTLPSLRWFRGKASPIRFVRVRDIGNIREGTLRAALTLCEVTYQEGPVQVYFIPVVIQAGDDADALARWSKQGAPWHAADAAANTPFLRWFHACMAARSSFAMRDGTMRFSASGDMPSPDACAAWGFEPVAAQQSNSSIIVQRRYMLKVYRCTEEGLNPEVECLRFLRHKGFAAVPALAGDVAYIDEAGREHSVALLSTYVESAGDGWGWLLGNAERCLQAGGIVDEGTRTGLRRLGDTTAALHAALAGDAHDKEFCPAAIGPKQVQAWRDAFEQRWVSARADLRLSKTPAAVDRDIPWEKIRTMSEGLMGLAKDDVSAIRVHGDFHLGQVLLRGEDWIVIDFEGEPLIPLAARKLKMSALKDVAGMLRSLDYAAHAAGGEGFPAAARGAFQRSCRKAFLGGYFDKASAMKARFLAKERVHDISALRVFEAEKALYELSYEIQNRPDWAGIPLAALRGLYAGDKGKEDHGG